VEGRLNIDTLMLWTRRGDAAIDLSPETISTLPPPLAQTLREHDIRGDAGASFSGSVPLRDPLSARADGTLRMTDASFASGEYRLPIDQLQADLALGEGALSLRRLDASLLGGALNATGGVRLTEPARPAHLSLTITDVDLERLLRATTPAGQDPSLAGLLSATVNATGALQDQTQLAGEGALQVRDGILVRTPGLSAVAQAAEVGSLTSPGQRTHTADIEFDLVPEGARITASRIETPTMLARGVGLVGFDQSLDLRVNAGPLEKLQGMLGQAGKLIGKLTDQLVTYRVTGTLGEPRVSVAPLGVEVGP
ncbi:MAG: AsmA-like C-terminal region-containing protein, partial [Phycisphaerales bacterium JB059]